MIVVAIIGILAAIAIPNFLRYQLRAKFAELPTNVNAIFKSEESLRQSERTLCVGAPTGNFVAFAALPAGGVPSSQKMLWVDLDRVTASAIDWVVQGATYGSYATATAAPPAGNAVVCAQPGCLRWRAVGERHLGHRRRRNPGNGRCLAAGPAPHRGHRDRRSCSRGGVGHRGLWRPKPARDHR